MPRPRVWPPKVRSHRGRDRAWWMGRWYEMGRTGSPEARAAYQRFLAECEPDLPPPLPAAHRPKLLVADLTRAFLAHLGTLRRARQTVERYERALGAVGELYGLEPVAAFGPLALAAVQRSLAERGLTRRYVSHLIACVRKCWSWGVARQMIPVELHTALGTVGGLERGQHGCSESREVEPVPDGDVERTLAKLRPTVADMVRLQRLSGMRPGEVCGLTPAEVHRAGPVRVVGRGWVDVGTLGCWLYAPASHKTDRLGHGRYVTLGPQAQAVLLPYLNRDPAACCFSPREDYAKMLDERRANRVVPLYPSHQRRREAEAKEHRTGRRGERYTVRTYRQAVERAALKAGVPHWHPHRLRHSAEAAIELRFDLDAARAVLGHRDPKVTARYGVRDVLRAAEVMREVG